jgi:hypothetical protein
LLTIDPCRWILSPLYSRSDRAAICGGHTTDYRRQGWKERRARETDARIVRVIDLERALSHLSEEHQSIVVLTSASTSPGTKLQPSPPSSTASTSCDHNRRSFAALKMTAQTKVLD